MYEILRNITRRKTRSTLTILGIFTGILALTVMGAMSERINRIVTGSEDFLTRQISVFPGREMALMGGLVLPEQMNRIREIPGVEEVGPVVELRLNLGTDEFVMGPPPSIHGVDLSIPFLHARHLNLPLRAGRALQQNETGVAVAGADVASNRGWNIGDTITLRDGEFQLVGILERLMTLPDQHVYIPIEDARTLLGQSFGSPNMPSDDRLSVGMQSFSALLGTNVRLDQVATGLAISWDASIDPQMLSDLIQEMVPELRVLSPLRMQTMVKQAMTIFNLIIVGSSLIALVVGGLSVINTMTMSVRERRGEIGLKKALGAPNRALFGEYMAEAACIGLIGGILGTLLGSLIVGLFNGWGAGNATQIFLITGRLIVFALTFATALGALSGLIPAFSAMRMNPVDALRQD